MDELNLYEYIAIFKRHLVAYAATAFAVFLAVGIFAATFSNYTSDAIINVQAPDIAEGMTVPIGVSPQLFAQSQADEKIEQIRQKVMASASLVEVISKFNLYPEMRETKPMSEVVELMRKKIRLQFVKADDTNPGMVARMQSGQMGAFAFSLSFTYHQPLLAQQVANEIVSRFVDEDMKVRRAQARETANFLEGQIAALEETMSRQEKALADFRAEHPNARPESLAFNQQMVATIALQIQDVERQIAATDKSRGDLRAQLTGVDPYSRVIADGQVLTTPAVQLKALRTKYNALLGQYGEAHPDVQKLRNQIAAIEAEGGGVAAPESGEGLQAQIRDVRANLAVAERTLGPSHPDVLALRRELARYQRQSDNLAPGGTGGAIRRDADNPAYLMLVSQIQGLDAQYASLTRQRDSLRAQQVTYIQTVATLPALEQQLEALTRDSENSKLRYRELKEKKMTADMSNQMEMGRRSERLEVVDPPALPTKTSPSKIKILALGLLGALFAGFGGVVVAEMLDRNLHGSQQVLRLAGVLPLAVIPHIVTAAERARRRRRVAALGAGGVALAMALLIAFDQTIMPLDVVVSVITRQIGL
ncbi:GumC family protein [Phaeospirillum tilakii]|uniref:GumC family protein n=1 Tax=Phaeospirillum tilakii TaxID=741673 RepID=A0ABW5CC79_9PROT